MKKQIRYFSLLVALVISSCGTRDNPTFQVKPAALGIMNDIVIICDQDIWDSPVADSLDYYYGGAFPITPSPEPIFDLRHFTPKDLYDQPLKKELRTYLVLADMNAINSETTEMVQKDLAKSGVQDPLGDKPHLSTIGRDKWASGQIIMYIMANGFDNLAEAVGAHFPTVSTRVLQHDNEQLRQSTFPRGTNGGLSRKVGELIGKEVKIPFGYKEAKEVPEENMISVSYTHLTLPTIA